MELTTNGPELQRLTKRLERERRARLEAETIAEKGLRELFQRQQESLLLETIAEAANAAASVEDAMRLALDKICAYAGCSLGRLSLVAGHPDGDAAAVATGVWHGPAGEPFAPFREAIDSTRFHTGVGLAGRILMTGRPAWIADLEADDNFAHMDLARRCGLRAAFGFPVLAGTEVVAVLEFFSDPGPAPDRRLLDLLMHIGTQLGRVIERQRAHEHMIDAFHDPLTRLPNRSLFLAELERAIRQARRHTSYRFAVLFLDIDGFKIVNDSLGHLAGDDLIVQIAARLTAGLRRNDVVTRAPEGAPRSPEADLMIARLGGDEFTILLSGIRDMDDAAQVARRIQTELAEPFVVAAQEVFVSASIGIASGDTGYGSAADVLRDADLAMYRAKSKGKGRSELFDPAMLQRASARLELGTDLRHAIDRRELRLQYQPIVSLDQGQIVGFEALFRWHHPRRGIVLPAECLPLAEETGMMIPLGDWVIAEACRQLRIWQDDKPQSPPLTMAINLFAGQFMDPGLVAKVGLVMRATGVEPMSVSFELTESGTTLDPERFRDTVAALKQVGVRLTIDDFGTGYSSLSYLTRFPVDAIKIDRAFVSRLTEQDASREVVRTIVSLAAMLGIDVIAEGTEQRHQADALKALGCRFAQGYYFSVPLDPAEAGGLLKLP